MELKKLAPWNWFKDEEATEGKHLPVNRTDQGHYTPLTQLHQEIDRMFDNAFRGFGLPSVGIRSAFPEIGQAALLKPNVDIASTDKDYSITVEVPGVEEDNIKLELEGNTLTVKGEKKQESETKEKDFYRVERSYGSFQRVLTLPEDADQDNIDAQFKNGVLTITLPKKAVEKADTKKIDIKKAA